MSIFPGDSSVPSRGASTSPYTGSFQGSAYGIGPSKGPPPPERHPEKKSRRRAPKACGECRRLKLKCDRVFPCQSCVKRGCQGICPDGSLVSGRGSRYILANTEQLHEKIFQLTDRIRELEDALQSLHEEHLRCPGNSAASGGARHPLLCDELLQVKSQLELYGISRSRGSPTGPPSRPGSASEDSEADAASFGNTQALLTPQSDYTDMRYQYFPNASAQSSSPFNVVGNQPYFPGEHTFQPPMSSLNLGPAMPQTQWDASTPSQTSHGGSSQYASPYLPGGGIPGPQQLGTYHGEFLQAHTYPQMDPAAVQQQQPQQQYAPVQIPPSHDSQHPLSEDGMMHQYQT